MTKHLPADGGSESGGSGSGSSAPVAMNHLLLGKKPLVTSKPRRGPIPGAVPPPAASSGMSRIKSQPQQPQQPLPPKNHNAGKIKTTHYSCPQVYMQRYVTSPGDGKVFFLEPFNRSIPVNFHVQFSASLFTLVASRLTKANFLSHLGNFSTQPEIVPPAELRKKQKKSSVTRPPIPPPPSDQKTLNEDTRSSEASNNKSGTRISSRRKTFTSIYSTFLRLINRDRCFRQYRA